MKKLLILFLLISSIAYAEDVVKYSGTTFESCQSIGDSRVWLTDPNDITTPKDGYLYVKDGCKSLPKVEPRFLEVKDGKVIEKAQADKDAIIASDLSIQDQAKKNAFNALVDQAKAEVDVPQSVSALLNLCISGITTDEIREIKKGTPKSSKTDQQLKDAVKLCLESLKQ